MTWVLNPRYQPDALYIQDAGQLVDVADEWGINRTAVSRGGVWADLNNDGFLDLITSPVDGPVKAYIAHAMMHHGFVFNLDNLIH